MPSTRLALVGIAGAAAAASLAVPALAAAPAAAPSSTSTGGERELRVIGLTTDDRLVRFGTDSPQDTRTIGEVDGLIGDRLLVGIDFRVQNGLLYGVGDRGGIYTLSRRTAEATRVSQLTVPLEGRRFGVDFNPAADRLRVISNTGQNLRHDVNTGGVTTVDGTLNYPDDDPVATGVTMAAYTNNDLSADSSTTLFDIDTNRDQVVAQAPANAGSLNATGLLGIDVLPQGGFDIYTRVGDDGRAAGLRPYATLRTDASGRYKLYDVRLLTGQVELEGAFPADDRVVDIAMPLNQL